MPLPKGGRGNKAPYETCIMRVPVPLREKFEVVAEQYRMALINEDLESADRYLQLDMFEVSDQHLSLSSALTVARELLSDKKMAKKRLIAKVLQLIYFDSKLSVIDVEKMLDSKDVTA